MLGIEDQADIFIAPLVMMVLFRFGTWYDRLITVFDVWKLFCPFLKIGPQQFREYPRIIEQSVKPNVKCIDRLRCFTAS